MTNELQLIAQLRGAKTTREIAQVTARVLRACGVFNFQAVTYELARMSVTGERE
jgi:superfamily II DNA or RNA helicase